jgi:hypothetical protein
MTPDAPIPRWFWFWPQIMMRTQSASPRAFNYMLHALSNLIKPTSGSMMTTPLFPTRAKGLHFSPYTYDMLGKLVRRVMSWVFSANEKDAVLTPHTAYSLRIGGAVALHDAGADGLVIAAMGQSMAQ